ncbi:MAG: agmatine deiminase family protein [Ectothiorhodospiraceae bacterium]|nr:agmatine deiminase family protein [Ectothiorhodospiraceae bacterium]
MGHGGEARWRMPAEWEPHRRCWMAWPMPEPWADDVAAVERDVVAVAHAIRAFEPVRVVVDPTRAARAVARLGADVEVVEIPLDDPWFRDTGPTFVRGADGARAGVCWRFNGWGGVNPHHANDVRAARALLARDGGAIVESTLALEGGAIATDGAGTILTTETVVLNPNRNPGLTRADAEAELARAIGARKVIWLPGNPHEYGTDGHIDGIACFVRAGVVMFERSAPDDPGFAVNEANRRALEDATDADGRAIEIVYIDEAPAAPRAQGKGWGYCRSYVNFYVANGGVVMPGFGIPEDAAAREAVAAAFPDREVVQVDVSSLGVGGGGIHCITQQEPA